MHQPLPPPVTPPEAGLQPPDETHMGAGGALAAAWGIAGQLALVLVPAALLLRAGVRGLAGDVGVEGWSAALGSIAVLCYFQGYRGFQRRYAPFVVARAIHLARHPRPALAALAPLHVCGLVHATARRRAGTAVLFAIMPLLALGVARLPAPYRAAVDLGVACGLLWGALAIAAFAARAAQGSTPAVALDLPSASPLGPVPLDA